MAKMSDKTKRAINRGRRKAGLKPIKFGATKKATKAQITKAIKSPLAICGICGKRIKKSKYYQHTGTHFK